MYNSNTPHKSMQEAVREGEYIIRRYLEYRGWVLGSKVLPLVGASSGSNDCDTWVLIVSEDCNGKAYRKPMVATADSIYAAVGIQKRYEAGAI